MLWWQILIDVVILVAMISIPIGAVIYSIRKATHQCYHVGLKTGEHFIAHKTVSDWFNDTFWVYYYTIDQSDKWPTGSRIILPSSNRAWTVITRI